MPTLDAPIVAVTVFTDRARVTRRGTTHLPPGEHALALTGLPLGLDEDSVRAAGRGSQVRILGVEVRTDVVTQAPDPNQAALEARLQALQDQDKALEDAEATQEARTRFLDTLTARGAAGLAKNFAAGTATLDNVETLAAYLTREHEAVAARCREIAAQRRALAAEIAAVRARIAPPVPPANAARRQRTIVVTVDAAAETDLELEVLYAVRDASWTPLYDLRLVDNRVTLTYLAHVRQRTGEDWPAVPLSLSTARPAVRATIPKLDAWYIDAFRVPPPVAAPRAYGSAAGGTGPLPALPPAAAEPQYMAAPPPPPPPVQQATAAIESAGAAVTYRVARPIAVPADGSPHRTTITTFDLPAELDYITVPKLAEEAYLRATITNNSDFSLLPGSAAIFHDADFVGTTALETIAPGATFEVQLGVDDRLTVERKLTEQSTAKALVGNTKRTLYAYQITLTSHLAVPARVTVYDQVPLSRHEEIKAKLQDATPRPTEQTGLNVLQWDLVLEPQAKRELQFSFLLEHPRNLRLVGIA
jgi:uncharacterized protein (TIGR02231 family)